MIGKFLIGRRTSINGDPVTVICGVVKGHYIVENDNFNAVLAKIEVIDYRIADDDVEMSPEDFLECSDDINWGKD